MLCAGNRVAGGTDRRHWLCRTDGAAPVPTRNGCETPVADPLCALWGAILLCAGDIASRTLLAPQELPIGIITAGIGGGFVIVQLMRNRT